jgi:hypothetical protein
MQDQDIVFGGEKKLEAAVREAYDLFHPKAITVFSTCPVGLIGDDMHAVARKMKESSASTCSASPARATRASRSPPVTTSPTTRCSRHIGEEDKVRGRGYVPRSTCWANTTSAATPSRSKYPSSAAASPTGRDILGQLDLRVSSPRPDSRPQHGHVPPVDQLRGRNDGEEVRHPLDQGQLHRRPTSTAKSLRKIAEYFEDPGADRPRDQEVICRGRTARSGSRGRKT